MARSDLWPDGLRTVHLRRCAQCGHIGCCDSSPSQHAGKHAGSADHPFIRSYEPGEDWFYNYADEQMYDGPNVAEPQHHPLEQSTPGPVELVSSNWQQLLN